MFLHTYSWKKNPQKCNYALSNFQLLFFKALKTPSSQQKPILYEFKHALFSQFCRFHYFWK